jgi:hypothetical protein
MKTFKQFLGQILENYRIPTQDQLDAAREIRRKQGKGAYLKYLTNLQHSSNRNLSPEQRHSRSIQSVAKESPLKPGEVRRYDKTQQKWVTNKP